MEYLEKRPARVRTQAQEKPGERLHRLKGSLLPPKPKEIQASLAKAPASFRHPCWPSCSQAQRLLGYQSLGWWGDGTAAPGPGSPWAWSAEMMAGSRRSWTSLAARWG